MKQPTDYVQSYCSIPDFLLEHSDTALWLQNKYGKIDGPCYWHDRDDNEDLFLARLNHEVSTMHREELELLAKCVNRDMAKAVKVNRLNRNKFIYRLLSKFFSFNKSK